MTTHDDPRSELLDLSARLRHLKAEHARAGAEGSVRRRIDIAVQELSDRLERRLTGLLDDDADREAWRKHAHHGGPAPERPEPGEGSASQEPGTPPSRPSGRRPWPR
jgi:hypothetical protein